MPAFAGRPFLKVLILVAFGEAISGSIIVTVSFHCTMPTNQLSEFTLHCFVNIAWQRHDPVRGATPYSTGLALLPARAPGDHSRSELSGRS